MARGNSPRWQRTTSRRVTSRTTRSHAPIVRRRLRSRTVATRWPASNAREALSLCQTNFTFCPSILCDLTLHACNLVIQWLGRQWHLWTHPQTFFCYLCGAKLNKDTPYAHFSDPSVQCYNLLFEGVEQVGVSRSKYFRQYGHLRIAKTFH